MNMEYLGALFYKLEPTILTLGCATLFLLAVFFLKLHRSSAARIPPGTRGLPLLGETLQFQRAFRANKAAQFVKSRNAKYGEVFRTSLYFRPTVVLHGIEANRFLYSNEGKLVREAWPNSVVSLLGENTLVAQTGVQHKRLRRLLMTCLCPDALEKFVAKVDELTQQHFAQHWLGRDRIALYKLVKSHTLNIASIVLISVEDPGRREELAKLFRTFISGFMTLPIYIPWTRFYQAHAARVGITKLLDEVISERRSQMKAGRSSELKDFITTLITAKDENDNPLTQKEIQDLIITLLFAGHDTNTFTMSLVCKFVSENPSCYDEVLKEQTAIAESQKPGEKLSWGDIQKMKYTWAAIQESLRMEPAVAGTFHITLKDFEYGGFNIPRGWQIYQSLSACHSDERYFPNPQKFDPSRFLEAGPARYTFHPFGGGPHICPGMDFARMTMLVFFHHLVRRFKWTLVNADKHIGKDPMQGLPIILEEKRL